MTKDATAERWKDEFGAELKPGLKCDIEITNEIGVTPEEINASTAWALRQIATQIEADELDTGFHPIKAPNGEEIGKVYLDHYASDEP